MFINNVNDEDLCRIIYRAGAIEFPKYCDLFNGDIEEFQQHCAVLILPKLKKWDNSKGALSTYIYNFLPLALGNWYARAKESKIMLFELNKICIDKYNEDLENKFIFVDDTDIPKELEKKDINKILEKIKVQYPTFATKEMEDLTFRQLGSKLKVGERKAQYLYIKDLIEIRKKYGEILKKFVEL